MTIAQYLGPELVWYDPVGIFFFFPFFYILEIWKILFFLENLVQFIILGKKFQKKSQFLCQGFVFLFSYHSCHGIGFKNEI
jgi:hypothetical protein